MPLYFAAIIAPDDINSQVIEWKQYMYEHYGCKVAMRSPAHVTLVPPFHMDVGREKALLEALKHCSCEPLPFDIALRNFAAFKPRVIYVDVLMNDDLLALKRRLEDFLIAEKFPIKRENRPFHPHVTIANRDLKKADFIKAWEHFKDFKYEALFVAQTISLLRSNKDGWKEVKLVD